MKRLAVLIAAAALACTAGALGTSAAGYGRHCAAWPVQTCIFVDEEGDGVCDRRTSCRYDTDGDGVCDRTPCGGRRARREAQ